MVAERIAAAISRGDLRPGDPLPSETRLSETFGVSRPVAREAIRDLVGLGIVQVQQGKVARVSSLGAAPLDKFYGLVARSGGESLREANELRRVIEPGVARLAAERRAPEGLVAIASSLERMSAAVQNAVAFTAADVGFHEGVALATGNRLVLIQIRGLRPIIQQVSEAFTNRGREPSDWQATYERHARIARAIETGDADAAAVAMSAQFDRADEAIRQMFPPS